MNTHSENVGHRERGNRYDARGSLAFRKLKVLQSSFRGLGMRIAALAVVCLVAGTIATSAQAPGASSAGSGSSNVTATASEVAAESRGNVQCPAKIASAPRDPSAPVDDVLGVRPGMTYEEAAAVVLCTNELLVVQLDSSRGVRIQTYGQKIQQGFYARIAEPKIQKTSKQIMQEMQDAE
jgi:hypothetical protein